MVISNNPTSGVTAQANTSNNSTSTSTNSTSTNPGDNLASEQTFLKLFVAQLQNQDPLNPNQQDPTQMVSELAQFSELEQLVNIGSDVKSIDTYVTKSATGTQTAGQTGATQGS